LYVICSVQYETVRVPVLGKTTVVLLVHKSENINGNTSSMTIS